MPLLNQLKCTRRSLKSWRGNPERALLQASMKWAWLFISPAVVAGAVILAPGYRMQEDCAESKLIDQKTRETLGGANQAACHRIRGRCHPDISPAHRPAQYLLGVHCWPSEKPSRSLPGPGFICWWTRQGQEDARGLVDYPEAGSYIKIALSISIAAASIIAKVHRDEMIHRWAPLSYPEYDLHVDENRLPNTSLRFDELGPTPLHRLSFAPVWMSQGTGAGRVFI